MAVAALFVAVLAVGIDSPPVGTTAEAWRLCTTGVLACPGIAGTITSTIAASAGVRGMQVVSVVNALQAPLQSMTGAADPKASIADSSQQSLLGDGNQGNPRTVDQPRFRGRREARISTTEEGWVHSLVLHRARSAGVVAWDYHVEHCRGWLKSIGPATYRQPGVPDPAHGLHAATAVVTVLVSASVWYIFGVPVRPRAVGLAGAAATLTWTCQAIIVGTGPAFAVMLAALIAMDHGTVDGLCIAIFGADMQDPSNYGTPHDLLHPSRRPRWLNALDRTAAPYHDHFVMMRPKTTVPCAGPGEDDAAAADDDADVGAAATMGAVFRAVTLVHGSPVTRLLAAVCTSTFDPGGPDPSAGDGARGSQISQLAAEVALWMANWSLGCTVLVSTAGSTSDDARTTLYFSHPLMRIRRSALLTRAEASTIIELAEHHAAGTVSQHPAGMGWTTSRHTAYATTDIPVAASYGLGSYLRSAGLYSRISATVSTAMGLDRGMLWGVRSTEMFVVKYAVNCNPAKVPGCGQAGLRVHQDGGVYTTVSFNILLNSPEAFDGGGTSFPAFAGGDSSLAMGEGRASDLGAVFKPCRVGTATIHPSKLPHGGAPVANGTRYILVGLMEFDSVTQRPRELLQVCKDVLSVWAPHKLHLADPTTWVQDIILPAAAAVVAVLCIGGLALIL